MGSEGLERLIAAIGVAIAAALTPVGVIYTAIITRRSRTTELTMSSLTLDVEKLGDRLEDTEEALQKERSIGLRWYQLALIWFNHAHEMRRQAQDARHMAESLAHRGDHPLPTWPESLRLPQLEGALESESTTSLPVPGKISA